MRRLFKLIPAGLVACALVLSLVACSAGSANESGSPVQDPASTQSALFSSPGTSNSPSVPVATDAPPASTGDIPALHPDEETYLVYTAADELITVSALRHFTLNGYSIVYDTEHYVCHEFGEGDNYFASEGNYLSVSLVFGMPMEDVIAGLRLQENIAMAPEEVMIGWESYVAQTLYFTTPSGLYRQFWVLDYAGDVLLVEQSYDTVSDNAALYRASQLAMLDTLTILY